MKTTLTRGSASAPFWLKFNSPGLGEYFRINLPGQGRERAAALFQFVTRCRRRSGGRAFILGVWEQGTRLSDPYHLITRELKKKRI